MLTGFAGKKICVAVSGGVDSVSLLHWLKERATTYGYTLCAVHCEHGIRGEDSLRDARFVREFCDKIGVELYSFSEDCPMRAERDKQSLETAARAFRIECFQRLLTEGKADVIATAHHKNDDAETVLFRLLRGTSLTGVGGISADNGKIIRPFLSWTRVEIEDYAKKNNLDFCVDCTNLELDATRNKLRLQALPLSFAAGKHIECVAYIEICHANHIELRHSLNISTISRRGFIERPPPLVCRRQAYRQKQASPCLAVIWLPQMATVI